MKDKFSPRRMPRNEHIELSHLADEFPITGDKSEKHQKTGLGKI